MNWRSGLALLVLCVCLHARKLSKDEKKIDIQLDTLERELEELKDTIKRQATTGECGISPVTQNFLTKRDGPQHVIGGKDATVGAWPWQVALYENGGYICGGSLISPTWVVTAAHCVSGQTGYSVVLGDHNRRTQDGNEQRISVTRTINHPDYDLNSVLDSDISLLQLSEAAVINERVRPVCLPRANEPPAVDTICYITGWGKVRHPGGSVQILQQSPLKVVDHATCSNLNNDRSITVTDNMLCAGYGPGNRRSGCHGDSGGPFVCQNSNGSWVLHGDVSWGSPRCDTSEAYSVFAKVSNFIPWINSHLTGNPPPTSRPRTTPSIVNCGGNITAEDYEQFITSPNHPGLYPPDTKCLWHIYGGFQGGAVIELRAMNLERNYDKIIIKLPNGDQELSGSLSDLDQKSFHFEGPIAVEFSSDYSEQRTGFRAAIRKAGSTPFPPTGIFTTRGPRTRSTRRPRTQSTQRPFTTRPTNGNCGGEIVVERYEQEFTSPNFPNNYQSNSRCVWTIYGHGAIELREMSLESGYDFININLDFGSINHTLSGDLSDLDATYFNFNDGAEVVFLSDSSVQQQGFRAVVRRARAQSTRAPTQAPTQSPNGCGDNFLFASSFPKILKSPGYPNEYPSSSSCSWSIHGNSVVFQLLYLDTEDGYDYLKINSYHGEVNETVSGKRNSPVAYQFQDTLNLIFSSDSSIQHRGFVAIYWQVNDSNAASDSKETLMKKEMNLKHHDTKKVHAPKKMKDIPAFKKEAPLPKKSSMKKHMDAASKKGGKSSDSMLKTKIKRELSDLLKEFKDLKSKFEEA